MEQAAATHKKQGMGHMMMMVMMMMLLLAMMMMMMMMLVMMMIMITIMMIILISQMKKDIDAVNGDDVISMMIGRFKWFLMNNILKHVLLGGGKKKRVLRTPSGLVLQPDASKFSEK